MDAIFEFHVARQARQRYQFDEGLFATDGRLIFADFPAARRFTDRIYAVSGRLLPASDIYAMGLMDEILHILVRQYVLQNPGVMPRALQTLRSQLGVRLDETLLKFTDEFPPLAVYRGEISAAEYLARRAAPAAAAPGDRGHEIVLEGMLLLSILNQNPAAQAYRELFDDSILNGSAYRETLALLGDFFSRQPRFGPQGAGPGETLVEVLLAPSRASPYSLEGQLQYLLQRWGGLLGEDILKRILRAIDFVREEAMRRAGPAGFQPAAEVPSYGDYPEYERYSTDRDWMPRLVLLAKNSYVWLEQLSRKYQRWIKTLDQIPDEELDLLQNRGFTGLWLIGLWERSPASQRVKQRMGDREAVASAYSLHGYEIAADLGGWDALQNLRARAWQRGLRLSADMVPNHMGIDSTWVVQHPDWFLSIDHAPYPSYSFNSENLSDDARVGIHLEDHYYDHSDAAVVFQRRDQATGDVRYIYHGNDGTAFPWNDTAQLDYSRPEVREAVIQTILHVARNFPIIRFDAAMTLAKKHIQRLWFPEPGSGGAIPSRAEYGLTRAEFDARIPEEFWREVVDRVAAEVPDTLLLAEAFWLMEGYFVRTLGMHRVYNSAFMHMLRDEDNAKYRQVIKNTLEFDPQILKRYVNFMNNPDEKTAVEQFGSGDKYFGVATLLATLPGLPMFGHGQIEGFHEKYGMEFRAPKMDEAVDAGLVHGHEWKIFPLLHRRHVFAEVEHFLLYDFYTASGQVNEDVFAYSNRHADERGLILYNNKYSQTRGWVRMSAAYLDKGSGQLKQRQLADGLGVPRAGYVIFRDQVTHLEYIRSCAELWDQGLYVELQGYGHHAFMDFRLVDGGPWAALHDGLQGAGAESLQAKYAEWLAAAAPPAAPAAKRARRRPPSARKAATAKAAKPKGGRAAKPKGRKAVAKRSAAKTVKPKKTGGRSAKSSAKKKTAARRPAPKPTRRSKTGRRP